MGTLAYMAPEQRFDASRVDHTADIYAVGATLFNILTAMNAMDLAYAEPDSTRWNHLPKPLRHVVQGAVREEPEDRYASAAIMQNALAKARSEL